MQKITPFLWFDAPLDEPIDYYRSIFPDMRVHHQSPTSAEFEIEGQRFKALNGGPKYAFNEAVSFFIRYLGSSDRAEADRVTQAMLTMRKIDVAALDRAAAGGRADQGEGRES